MSVNQSHNPIYTKLNKILKDLKNLRDCFPRASVLKTTIFSKNMDHAHGWGASLGCFHNTTFLLESTTFKHLNHRLAATEQTGRNVF